jgi:CHAT domain-containing protein/Tfp pilus assembly protein PilF
MGLRDWFQRSPRKTTDELLAEAREHAAASRFEEALSVYSTIRKRDRTPAILVEMARACSAQDDDQGALSYASDARDAAGTAGSPREIAAAMCVQGEVLLRERRRTDAMDRFREALALDPGCELARAALESENPPRSRPIDPEALVATKSRPPSVATSDEAWARNQLAEIAGRALKLHRQGRFDEALPAAEDAVRFARRHLGEAHPDYASTLNNLAELYESKGDYATAEPLLRQALEATRVGLGEAHPDYASSLNNLGVELYKSKGDYAAAEPLLRQALELRRAALGQAHPDYATSLNNLAELYKSKGDYAAANPLLREALEVRRAALGEAHPDYAGSLNNLAGLYRSLGDYATAEPLLRQALEVRRAALGDAHPDYAQSLHNLGELLRSKGDYASAEPLYRQALVVLRAALGEAHPDYAESLNNLAALYLSKSDYASAEPLVRQALVVRRAALGEAHPDYAVSLNNLAGLYWSRGDYTSAEPLYRQALDVRRASLGEAHPDYAKSLSRLAGLYAATERPLDAWALMARAVDIRDRTIGQLFSISSDRQRLATLEQIRGEFDAFLSLVSQSLTSSPDAVASAADLVVRRKALAAGALATQRDAVLGGKYPHLAARLEELTTFRRQIAQAVLAGPGLEGPEAHRQRLAEWEARKDRLEADLARRIPEMNVEQRLRAADRRAVALDLPEGITLVEFVRFRMRDFRAVRARNEEQWKEWRYLAFVLPARAPDDLRMIDLGEADPIDRMIADFRESLTGPDGRDVTATAVQPMRPIPEAELATGQALRRAVFDPLVEALGDQPRLLLSPDGDLSRLPFGVLPTDDGRLLIEDRAISYSNCGRDVLRFAAPTTGQSTEPLVAADPDFNLGCDGTPASIPSEESSGRRSRDLDGSLRFPINRLEGTRQEGEQIARMLGIEPWLEDDVLEGRLKEECRSPRILHLATHGFFLEDQHRELRHLLRSSGLMDRLTGEMHAELGPLPENPLLRSGLILAGVNTWHEKGRQPLPGIEDGLLTAEDVTGLDLLATDPVVLSACDTGLGEVHTGEGVFGLQRAFILAGAKTLIMSLWKVPDQQTQELMVDFYRRLLAGEGKAEALRNAQLAMKAKYPDPYYWGAFVCLGEPGPLSPVPTSSDLSSEVTRTREAGAKP